MGTRPLKVKKKCDSFIEPVSSLDVRTEKYIRDPMLPSGGAG